MLEDRDFVKVFQLLAFPDLWGHKAATGNLKSLESMEKPSRRANERNLGLQELETLNAHGRS